MVTKKKVTKKRVAVRKATPAVDIKKQIQEETDNIENQLQAGGGTPKIKINRNKTFTLPDGSTVEQFGAVIVAFSSHYLYYDKPYVEGQNATPACFAIGNDPKSMVPSDSSPSKQAEKCNEKGQSVCPYDVFGSKGKGKMCQNRCILALLEPGAGPEDTFIVLSISPTGLKRYTNYVKYVKATHNLPPVGVITQFAFNPKEDFTSLVFGGDADNPDLSQCWARRSEAELLLADESQYIGT